MHALLHSSLGAAGNASAPVSLCASRTALLPGEQWLQPVRGVACAAVDAGTVDGYLRMPQTRSADIAWFCKRWRRLAGAEAALFAPHHPLGVRRRTAALATWRLMASAGTCAGALEDGRQRRTVAGAARRSRLRARHGLSAGRRLPVTIALPAGAAASNPFLHVLHARKEELFFSPLLPAGLGRTRGVEARNSGWMLAACWRDLLFLIPSWVRRIILAVLRLCGRIGRRSGVRRPWRHRNSAAVSPAVLCKHLYLYGDTLRTSPARASRHHSMSALLCSGLGILAPAGSAPASDRAAYLLLAAGERALAGRGAWKNGGWRSPSGRRCLRAHMGA